MTAYSAAIAVISMVVMAATPCFAQTFQKQPIQIILGTGPGSPSDLIARRVAPVVEKRLGQAVIIEHRPGAQLSIAANAVSKANPDGHTLYFGVITTFHPLFLKNNSVVALNSFAPVSNLAIGSTFVFTSVKSPFSTLPEMIAYAKANPGKLNHGSSSATNEMQMKVLADKTGITFTHVPYKTVVQGVTALASGEIDIIAATSLGSFISLIKAGSVRPMMVVGLRRSNELPEIPTSAELGIKGYVQSANQGLWAPIGTPAAVTSALNAAFVAAVKDPEVAKFITSTAYDPDGSTSAEQARITEDELRYWADAVRLAKFEPQ